MTQSARLGLWSLLVTLLLTASAATASLAIAGLGPWWPFGPLWLSATGLAIGAPPIWDELTQIGPRWPAAAGWAIYRHYLGCTRCGQPWPSRRHYNPAQPWYDCAPALSGAAPSRTTAASGSFGRYQQPVPPPGRFLPPLPPRGADACLRRGAHLTAPELGHCITCGTLL